MKRSEINSIIRSGKAFMAEIKFSLPRWAYWKPEQWKGRYEQCREIVDNMLGWDITDFGSGSFYTRGLLLFTLRNGNLADLRKPYAEKIMIVEEEQETPLHFHWSKIEDIINRGGGNLVIELYGSTEEEELSDLPIAIKIDGIFQSIEPGGRVVLEPGDSICLEKGVYHRFFAQKGTGRVLVGEVSSVNDDTTDNRFYEPVGRFPSVDEDESPLHLLVSDYKNFL